MPRGDRTGPMEAGPRTGRAMGYCSGYPIPGLLHAATGCARGLGFGHGRGRGMGLGRSRGWRRFWGYPYPAEYYPPIPGFRTPKDSWGAAEITVEQERNMLKSEAKMLKEEIVQIEKRIKELEGEKK